MADQQATVAEQFIYHELSRGHDLLTTVQRTRQELQEHFRGQAHQAWPLLRLYTSGMMPVALVQSGQKARPKPRKMVHTFLKNSQVKILETGFVGRRRQIQQSLRVLKQVSDKIGVLLHGTGGLGKSCLVGKLCERFSDHTLIIVHGRLNTISVRKALDEAFIIANDEAARQILQAEKEMPEKLAQLCATCFKEKNYLFVFDDFEQNIEGAETGAPGQLLAETVPILQTLLHYLPLTGKMTQLLITSRYDFMLTENERDLVADRLEKVPLHSFQTTEQHKKARELPHILNYPNDEVAQQLLAAGHGNPRLMEWLNQLVGSMPQTEVPDLLAAVRDKKEEFIRQHVIRELLHRSGEPVEKFLLCFSVFRLPVEAQGAECIAQSVLGAEVNWQHLLHEGVRLSLVEHDHARQTYWLTPLLREELWDQIKAADMQFPASSDQRQTTTLHEAVFAYYEKVCSAREQIDPTLTEEWIYHALGCGREDVAVLESGKLINFLRDNLSYLEARRIGEWVLAEKRQSLETAEDAFLLNEIAYTLHSLGEYKKAISYLEQALKIDRTIFGENHPNVSVRLNNLGLAWDALGDHQKAINYYEEGLKIDRATVGENYPGVAVKLNNLGLAWHALGEYQKAIAFFEQALIIDRAFFGENHPNVANRLNNLGFAWHALGKHQKAISYYEQALVINHNVYGESHPEVSVNLNNLGAAWHDLGEYEKAIAQYEQALKISRTIFGVNHPEVANLLDNLGKTWQELGQPRKGLEYHEQALKIDQAVFGENHPNVATRLNNLGLAWYALNEHQRAIANYERAIRIYRATFGDNHPNVVIGLINLGTVWNASGEYEKAIGYLDQALVTGRNIFGELHPQVALTLNNLGSAWNALGEHQKAIGYCEQALTIDCALYGNKHPNIAIHFNNLGFAWLSLGEHQKAIEYYEQALVIDRAVCRENDPNLARDLNNLGAVYFTLEQKGKAKMYFQEAYDIFNRLFGPVHPNTKNAAKWLAACE